MELNQKNITVKKIHSVDQIENIFVTDDAEIKKLYSDLSVGLNVFIKERFVN